MADGSVCYLHPMMDWELMKMFVGIDAKHKEKAWLQRWLIQSFSPEISLINSSYGHNFSPDTKIKNKAFTKKIAMSLAPDFLKNAYRQRKRAPNFKTY